jgi:energy-coupling factor transporter ATP-binding protein EcfA2
MLKSLEIKNFTVFEEANLEFSEGLNVLIGENGTGKTQLLKLGNALLKSLNNNVDLIWDLGADIAKELIFSYRAEQLPNLIKTTKSRADVKATLFGNNSPLKFSITKKDTNDVNPDATPVGFSHPKPIFFPAREILSHYTGFGATLRNRELSFDQTFLDLADALALPPLKGKGAEKVRSLVQALEQQMGGRVMVENERFYIVTDKQRLEMPLVAEGIRKIAMLAYLVMNGSIQKGSTLFWDEPEANLNPKMLLPLAQTLITLANLGIQIFLATHSLFLLRELEIQTMQNPQTPVRYFALARQGQAVTAQQGNTLNDVDPIASLDANLEQSERYLELV